MKKGSAILIIYLILSCSAAAQNKILDVDRLFDQYKNSDSITITNAKGGIKLGVTLAVNEKGEPISIILSGYVENKDIANSLKAKLCQDKIKAGYKYDGTSQVYSDLENVTVDVYTKGSQYAKYGIPYLLLSSVDSPPPYDTGTEEQKKKRSEKYFFAQFGGSYIYLEVGDISRKLNDEGKDFTF